MLSWILGTGFVLLAIVGLIVELVARRADSTRPTVGELLGILVATRTGRVLAVLVWGWLGWHFLAR